MSSDIFQKQASPRRGIAAMAILLSLTTPVPGMADHFCSGMQEPKICPPFTEAALLSLRNVNEATAHSIQHRYSGDLVLTFNGEGRISIIDANVETADGEWKRFLWNADLYVNGPTLNNSCSDWRPTGDRRRCTWP